MKALLILTFILSVVELKSQVASATSPKFTLLQHKPYVFTSPQPQPQPLHQPRPLYSSYLNHLPGMFCKMEHKIESKSKLAPRFRLGSLNYTNWMEGKGELYSRYWK